MLMFILCAGFLMILYKNIIIAWLLGGCGLAFLKKRAVKLKGFVSAAH